MAHVATNGIRIEYELSGPEDDRVLLMIHSVGAQMIRWPAVLCAQFERAGFRLLRFGNRDIGLSTHFDGLGIPDIAAIVAARAAERAYNPAGPARQLVAARGAADRRSALHQLSVPALVVLGGDDPLFAPECGSDLSRSNSGAWLLEVNGMGHDLPAELFDLFVASVTANCARLGTWEK
jgi:pimeloyl-ACP methyl ester carboxylesterase